MTCKTSELKDNMYFLFNITGYVNVLLLINLSLILRISFYLLDLVASLHKAVTPFDDIKSYLVDLPFGCVCVCVVCM